MIGEAARQAGARVIATGDTAQLGAVEAGGMFRLLAREVPAARAARGPPVRRAVGAGGQRPAPRRRPGRGRRLRPARPDPRRRPRSRLRPRRLACGSPTTCAARTSCCWPDPTPKPPSCPAACRPSSPSSASVGPPQATLADGNHAGVGDLVRARLNTEIDAGGRPAHQPGHAASHRVARAGRRGAAAASGRDLDRAVPGAQVLPAARTPSSPTPATSTSPRAAPSTPPTSSSPTPCPGRPCTSA